MITDFQSIVCLCVVVVLSTHFGEGLLVSWCVRVFVCLYLRVCVCLSVFVSVSVSVSVSVKAHTPGLR